MTLGDYPLQRSVYNTKKEEVNFTRSVRIMRRLDTNFKIKKCCHILGKGCHLPLLTICLHADERLESAAGMAFRQTTSDVSVH